MYVPQCDNCGCGQAHIKLLWSRYLTISQDRTESHCAINVQLQTKISPLLVRIPSAEPKICHYARNNFTLPLHHYNTITVREMLASHCILKMFTNLQLAFATIHFWLLFTQRVVSVTAASLNAYTDFDMRQHLLIDETLTYCGSEDHINRRPVCATANDVDYVLFGSECLLWQTNRERHNLDTGETSPIFRKIALGLCRPNCSVAICEDSEQPICARNLKNDEVRRFNGHCEMARDLCLNGNDWQPIANSACSIVSDVSLDVSAITASTSNKLTPPFSKPKSSSLNSTNPKTLGIHYSPKLPKKQIRKHQRKAIPCPKVFNPVCAELSGVKATFINECLVNAENVNFGRSWNIFSKGVCAEDYTSSETHKPAISKRNTVGDATATYEYQLNAFKKEVNDNISLIPYTRYMKDDLLRSYEEQNRLYESSIEPTRLSILPTVDDRVIVCKFGDDPVCGSSTRYTAAHNFENVCELLLRNIILNESWKVLGKGECSTILKELNHTEYEHITGYTNLNGTGQEFFITTPHPASHEVLYFPRHARKVCEPIAEQERNNNTVSNASSLSQPESSVKLMVVEKSTSPKSSKKSFKNSTNKSLVSKPTTKPAVTQSHIMNLWRSSKRRRSRAPSE